MAILRVCLALAVLLAVVQANPVSLTPFPSPDPPYGVVCLFLLLCAVVVVVRFCEFV